MRRRESIALLGGVAAAWPWFVGAQAPKRRLGVLFVLDEDHPEVPLWLGAVKQRLRTHGWIEGQTIEIEVRFGRSDPERVKRYTEELIALTPDVILAQGVVGAAAMKRATTSIPVVFVQVQDPIGGGFVQSVARPEGNLTGFTNFDYSIVSKWLQLLKYVAPRTVRVMAIINPDNRARWDGYTAAFAKYAPVLGITPQMAGAHDEKEIESAIARFAAEPNGGLVVLPDATMGVHANLLVELAERHRLPTVYPSRYFARAGGLLTYSDNGVGQYEGAASYVDRLLRGAKVSGLPIQSVDRFETIINLKTAAKIGITIPPALLAAADSVIE
jgi:putative ABC transport system substrate-binding protein